MNILITGITGQDGAWLARSLVDEGHTVYGAIRRGSTPKTGRLEYLGILDKVNLVPLEITEFSNVYETIAKIKPAQIYNLAAQSFVKESFINPVMTSNVNYNGVLNILESIRMQGLACAVYQASTSEMYGDVTQTPQTETTSFSPLSPYGVSKAAAHYLMVNYRKAYGMHCTNGTLFNHESELRGKEFVTRKITSQLAEIKMGRTVPVMLGNMDAVRDWGYAPEYVEAMKLIMNARQPDDFVVATNTTTTVRDFFTSAAMQLGFNPEFSGSGESEICIDKNTSKLICTVSKDFYRPSDVNFLQGDHTKIKTVLGWEPTTTAQELAAIMAKFDLDMCKGNITSGASF
jgi:GDPmannose 4,6-dehydratase